MFYMVHALSAHLFKLKSGVCMCIHWLAFATDTIDAVAAAATAVTSTFFFWFVCFKTCNNQRIPISTPTVKQCKNSISLSVYLFI